MTYWNGTGWEVDRPATPPRPKRGRRLLGAATEAGLITLLMFGLIAGTTLAASGGGKGGGGNGGGGKTSGGGTISLVVIDGSDATPNYMERVAFDVSTTATDRPFVGLRCYQGAAFVLDGYTGYFDSYMFDPWITLGSPYWNADLSADCTARLFHYNKRGGQVVLATTSFTVQP